LLQFTSFEMNLRLSNNSRSPTAGAIEIDFMNFKFQLSIHQILILLMQEDPIAFKSSSFMHFCTHLFAFRIKIQPQSERTR
jgi:hypothetical protein